MSSEQCSLLLLECARPEALVSIDQHMLEIIDSVQDVIRSSHISIYKKCAGGECVGGKVF